MKVLGYVTLGGLLFADDRLTPLDTFTYEFSLIFYKHTITTLVFTRLRKRTLAPLLVALLFHPLRLLPPTYLQICLFRHQVLSR